MKFKIAWSSPRQGIQSTTVDALNSFAAQEQVESMYAHIEGFNLISTTPVFDKQESYESYDNHEPSYSSSSGSDDDDFSAGIAGVGIVAGGCIILFGLFTLPTGIGAMIIGGAIGWLSWKLACWLSDRGW